MAAAHPSLKILMQKGELHRFCWSFQKLLSVFFWTFSEMCEIFGIFVFWITELQIVLFITEMFT